MGKLFDISDVKAKQVRSDQNGSAVKSFSNKVESLLIENKKRLHEVLGEIKQGVNYSFVTGGRWSAHDLLFYVLNQTGPAKIYLCTWAISEIAARLLLRALEEGLILELNCIFDRRLPVRKDKTMQLAKNIATRISLVDCHAKMFVIENESWGVTIQGSANLTNNKRIEAGCIFTERSIMDFNKKWIMDQLQGGDPFNWKK